MKEILIFDTTLRDGEQSPGATMNMEEKIQIALQLEKLGVDIIEAGFAAASDGDYQCTKEISHVLTKSKVCSLARANERDIERAGQAMISSKNNRIHTFIATSPIHMEYKLKMKPDEVMKRAINAVELAKCYTEDIEFSFEDAGRSDVGFLKEMADAVILAGAKTINLPDTVGILMPDEIGKFIKEMSNYIQDRAIISVHNHNDLGLGTINSIEAIKNGAKQIECTINGIGERAGNAAMEEIIMIIDKKLPEFKTNINKKEIYHTSKMVADITGMKPQANKAIIGKNAFAHESGIHQDGMLKNKETYQIIDPKEIGYDIDDTLVLGKLSGRAAIKDKIDQSGYKVNDEQLNSIFERFKALCDKKKEVYNEDLISLVKDEINKDTNIKLDILEIEKNKAKVVIEVNKKKVSSSIEGNGIVDSIFKSIDSALNEDFELIDYKISSVSEKKDSQAEAIVKIKKNNIIYVGKNYDTDTMIASAKAYINAINKIKL